MKALRIVVAALLVLGAMTVAGLARADVSNGSADNVQDGQNRTNGSQTGSAKTGSAIGGQVSGVVSGGPASVDAKNKTTNSDVTTGHADGTNSSSSFTGLNSSAGGPVVTADVTNACGDGCANLQDGDNRATLSQSATATTGDGVAGEVIGVIASGSASIVADNHTDNSDVDTGDGTATNDLAAFVGLNSSDTGPVITSDVSDSCNSGCDNVQSGDDKITARQSAGGWSGDGVAGQVVGAVAGGNLRIDAKSFTDNSDVTTGDGSGANAGSFFAGLNSSSNGPTVTASDVSNACGDGCANLQDGDNRVISSQSSTGASGDGVGGQVVGGVTLGHGSASVVASNRSKNTDISTGDGDATNDLAAFVGLNDSSSGPLVTSDLDNVCNISSCDNLQTGDNRLTGSQTAKATTGDGVGGEVVGVNAAGAGSIDASNHSENVDIDTGDATAANDASSFVGLNTSDFGPTVTVVDVTNSAADNLQDGDNHKRITQAANATSGDGIAGQVAALVTGPGGAARLVLSNTSEDIDSQSGSSDFSNTESAFVGLNASANGPLVG